ncbi:MAG: low specificity L-threonine aldolase, partial [Verrucomicrobiaceae bacterium]
VDGAAGKMDPGLLLRELGHFRAGYIHTGQPMAVSLTQATEVGTVYQSDEIAAISTICRDRGLPLHMDGARFANALASLSVTPAEMTWKQGVDVVSFGGTKNGCWCAEALVYFDPEQARDLPYIRKRAAQLFSKTRFIAAQFEAYLADGLWLQLATRANETAARLAEAVRGSSRCRLAWEVQANEVFAIVNGDFADEWRRRGVGFYPWPVPGDMVDDVKQGEIISRLVTSFSTTDEEVEEFRDLLAAES